MEKLEFNSLPASARETFVARSLAYGAPGGPLIRELTDTRFVPAGQFFLALALLWLLWGGYALGFGEPGKDGFQVGAIQFALIASILSAIAYIVLSAWRRAAIKRALPYPPGKYVFPLEIVDATTSTLKRYPMSQVLSVSTEHNESVFKSGANVTFHFRDATSLVLRAAGSKATVTDDVARLQDARREVFGQGAKSEEGMERLDPFYQLGRDGSGWRLK